MKALLKYSQIILFIFFFSTSKLFGQDCTQLPYDLENYSNKNRISFDDMLKISELVKGVNLQTCNIDVLKPLMSSIKEKRLETVKMYLKLGIKNEGNVDLSNEYNYLSGAPSKFSYEFENIFSVVSKSKTNITPMPYPPINNRPPSNTLVNNSACTNKINQNDAVNLNNTRNQDSVGWCYAYAASDLLSFRFKKKISAVSLFEAEGKTIEQDIVNGSKLGGDIQYSINQGIFKRKGLCLEENLPSSDFKFCADQNYLSFLNEFINRATQERFAYDLQTDSCLKESLLSAFPGMNIEEVINYSKVNKQSRLIEFIHDTQCKVQFKKEAGLLDAQNIKSNGKNSAALFKVINEQIEKGDVAAIGYDFNKLNSEPGKGDHGSIVVGRRTNQDTGACEYLVRNSWGKDCRIIDVEGLNCHKECTNEYCRQTGHFWVSEERLSNVLINVTYLK